MKNCISRRSFLKAAGILGAAGALAACGGSSSTSTAASSTASSAAASAASTGASIKLWTYPIGGWGNDETVQNLISSFNAKYPDIKVTVEYLDYTNGDDQVNTAIEGGSAPDLVMEGPERSVPVESVLEQVREAQEAGVPEVVLTGVNLGAYDGKSATDEHVEIDELLEAIMERTSIPHVRISSVEPMDISERLLKVMARYPQRIAPFLHLPVQSGCTATLHRMGRPYSAEAFEDTVRMIRAILPQASLSCDVIVGFPGETDEEFEESLALCRRVGFSRMHVFRYSKRPGTLAADMPDQVPPEVMAERSRRMRAAAQELAIADARRRVGTVERAVLEYGDNLTLGSFHHARLDDTCGLTAPCLLDVAIIGVDDSGLVHARREVHGSLED